MSIIFPFGFPAPTAFYLTLYVLTFALHQVFMHYVLAGSLYVAWTAIWPGHGSVPRTEQPIAATLRDWMPFLLSAAITAGVAPLLFVQIVYQHQFYTANLLLWWRWMMVVPVLIVAFYLLYLVKSSVLWRWPIVVRVAVPLATSISFVFVGFCWTVNHLLSNHEAAWPDVYATNSFHFATSAVAARMLIWIGGSFATMSVMVGWQLFYRQQMSSMIPTKRDIQPADSKSHEVLEPPAKLDAVRQTKANEIPADAPRGSLRTLAVLTGGGLGVALIAGLVYLGQSNVESRSVVFGYMILPYLILLLTGILVQGIGWTVQWRSDRFGVAGLTMATLGAVSCLLGVSVIREGLRLRAIDVASLADRHAEAATVGGFGVFIVASVLVLFLIAWCVRVVQTGDKEFR